VNILVIGAGYAGVVTAAGLAELGHTVVNLDRDPARIAVLRSGGSPVFEPGLDGLLARTTAAGRLSFIDSYADVELAADSVVFIVVGTPARSDGHVDLSQVDDCIEALAPHLTDGVTVVMKSTVPVGTARQVMSRLRDVRADASVSVASNPEFLRQGAAVDDFLDPDRIVVGTQDDATAEVLRRVYRPLLAQGVAAVFSTLESAELIKYASNAFLATKLSFINEIADLCEASGGLVEDVARGIGLDPRIGPSFLRAGPGFGGSCLPKDTQALLHTSTSYGTGSHIVRAALEVNHTRIQQMADRILEAAGKHQPNVGMLGITFKADTDDIRESPAVAIARELVRRGVRVRLFDPQGLDRAATELGDGVEYAPDEYSAAAGADVVVIATEWKQFGALSLKRLAGVMAAPVLVDLRNMWDPAAVTAAGLRYVSIGRQKQL
jgi:UDPglucose 6-dehydrogenase